MPGVCCLTATSHRKVGAPGIFYSASLDFGLLLILRLLTRADVLMGVPQPRGTGKGLLGTPEAGWLVQQAAPPIFLGFSSQAPITRKAGGWLAGLTPWWSEVLSNPQASGLLLSVVQLN